VTGHARVSHSLRAHHHTPCGAAAERETTMRAFTPLPSRRGAAAPLAALPDGAGRPAASARPPAVASSSSSPASGSATSPSHTPQAPRPVAAAAGVPPPRGASAAVGLSAAVRTAPPSGRRGGGQPGGRGAPPLLTVAVDVDEGKRGMRWGRARAVSLSLHIAWPGWRESRHRRGAALCGGRGDGGSAGGARPAQLSRQVADWLHALGVVRRCGDKFAASPIPTLPPLFFVCVRSFSRAAHEVGASSTYLNLSSPLSLSLFQSWAASSSRSTSSVGSPTAWTWTSATTTCTSLPR